MKSFHNEDRLEVGIDEAGRGCLFGRVYAAAVILPRNFQEEIGDKLILRDSKKVSKKNRKILRKLIEEYAIDYNVSYSEHYEIDEYNIYQATMNTMHKALDGLKIRPDLILVDGNTFRKYEDKEDGVIEHECIIKGDNVYKCIAAASILAKEYRDEYIEKLCEERPELRKYNIHKNMGYGARAHIDGIKENGIVSGHRLTFGICKKKSLFTNK